MLFAKKHQKKAEIQTHVIHHYSKCAVASNDPETPGLKTTSRITGGRPGVKAIRLIDTMGLKEDFCVVATPKG